MKNNSIKITIALAVLTILLILIAQYTTSVIFAFSLVGAICSFIGTGINIAILINKNIEEKSC